jgi:magnesium-transporting ATPase (P-type)
MFMMYKNFAMILVYFWSSVEALASPIGFYDEFLLSFFNLLFTLFPPFAYGGWEKDAQKRDLLATPQIYKPRWNPMGFPLVFIYFGLAFWHGVVVYFVVRYGQPEGALEANGNLAYICIVCVVTAQFLIWATDWNALMLLSILLTIVLLFGVILIYAYAVTPSLVGVIQVVLGGTRGWLILLCTICGAVLPYLAVKVFVDLAMPHLKTLIQEKEKKGPPAILPTCEDDLPFWKLMKGEDDEFESLDGKRLQTLDNEDEGGK